MARKQEIPLPVADPIEFGWVRTPNAPDGVYYPCPEEIREQCEFIQRTWTKRERYTRRVAMPQGLRFSPTHDLGQYAVPTVSTRGLGDELYGLR
jgi:hypothetical protein